MLRGCSKSIEEGNNYMDLMQIKVKIVKLLL